MLIRRSVRIHVCSQLYSRQYTTMASSRPPTPDRTDSSTSSTDDPHSQALILPYTSRSIGFASYGPDDGTPLFFLHGLPGSRHDARYFADLANKHAVRVVGIDRPGYGLSTFDGSRSVGDYACDLLAVADHLKIDTFRVIGLSGGGPYALACALHIPPTRLLSTGIYEGIAAIHETGLNGMGYGFYSRLSWWLFIHFPSLGRWLARKIIFRKVLNSSNPAEELDKVMAKAIDKMKDGEREDMFTRSRPIIVQSMVEAFRQGAEGYCVDGELLAKDWGFRIKDIPKDRRIYMWYGAKDVFTPVKTARYVLEQLGGKEVEGKYVARRIAKAESVEGKAMVQLRVYPEGDHEKLLYDKYKEDIFTELMEL